MEKLDLLTEYDPDEVHEWDRQPWDTDASHDRFRRFYLPMQAPRSVNQAYRDWKTSMGEPVQTVSDAPTIWGNWSRGKNGSTSKKIEGSLTWRQRAHAWDLHLAKVADLAKMQRAIEIAQADYDAGSSLRDLANTIMDAGPQFIKSSRRSIKGKRRMIVGADGRPYEIQEEPDREIITMQLDIPSAIRAFKVASELQRTSADMSAPVQKMALTDAAGQDVLPVQDVIEMLKSAQREMEEQIDNEDPTSD